MPNFKTIDEVADHLGVSKPTVYTLLRVIGAAKQYQQINGRPRRVIPDSVIPKLEAARGGRGAAAHT